MPDVNSSYEVAIGDDAAVRINKAGERLIITADISVENVHFTLDTMTFEEIGYRAMVSNLSDCAAMGATPDSAVVQLVFPKGGGEDVNGAIEKIYTGFTQACSEWNFPIVGGDLSGGAVWTVGITLIGSLSPGDKVAKRTGISDGDALWVTGTPGGSAAGLAALAKWGRAGVLERYQRLVDLHIRPTPRVNEARILAACGPVSGMMDLSDGLSKDVGTLCFDNGLGFIFERGLVSSPDMVELADELDWDWQDWFYHGGEEYELLLSCAPSFDPRGIINTVNITRLGFFTSKYSGMFIEGYGGMEELPPRGWDHC